MDPKIGTVEPVSGLDAVRRALVAGGRRLGDAGLIRPGEGNLSVRTGRWLVITPRGRDKAALRPGDPVVLAWHPPDAPDWRNAPLPDGASSETRMHLAILAVRPDVLAVVHAHPPAVLAATARGLTVALPDGAVPSVPFLEPGSAALAEAVATALAGGGPACILEAHGAVTVGGTVEEAVDLMAALEAAALGALRRAGFSRRREWTDGRERSGE